MLCDFFLIFCFGATSTHQLAITYPSSFANIVSNIAYEGTNVVDKQQLSDNTNNIIHVFSILHLLVEYILYLFCC